MIKSEKNRILGYKNRLDIINKGLTKEDKKIIDAVLKRVIREHGETLRLLGRD